MKKRILGLLAVLVLVLALVSPASATPPGPASGDIIPAGPDSGMLTGTFSGTYTFIDAHGRVSRLLFEGSIDGEWGTLLLNIVDVGPNGLGYWTVLDSTGELTGLHGQGTFAFPLETQGSYEGQIHIDP